MLVRQRAAEKDLFQRGAIRLATGAIHTVKPLEVAIPQGRLTVVTGVSGSGKTTMVLESLIPGLEAATAGEKLPGHVREVDAPGIRRVKLIDATPIGINVRSTVATLSLIHIYFSARTVATTTTQEGARPAMRHLMSINFSAPRSEPKPASVMQ